MNKYAIYTTELGDEVVVLNNVTFIPNDLGNTDYQDYLAWVAEGNIPEQWNPEA